MPRHPNAGIGRRLREEDERAEKQNCAEQMASTMGMNEKPFNQVDDLRRQVEVRTEVIEEQQEELLGLYRRLYQTDRPNRY